MTSAVTTVDVRRVAGSLGAEVRGVRVGPDLPGPVVKLIRDALLEHKVIFFRGQDHLDDAGQAGFARLFGELSPARRQLSPARLRQNTASRAEPGDAGSYVHDVVSSRSKATVWHTDNSLTVRPAGITMLRSMVLPPYGGDTAFANTATAYQRMGPEWQELADGLRAVHTNDMVAAVQLGAEAAARAANEAPRTPREALGDLRRPTGIKKKEKRIYETEHPVVRVHPETGERTLLVGAFAKKILGRDDSDRLIELFQSVVTSLDNTIRWRWKLGDMAMWDNRATQHCAIADHGSHERVLHRVVVLGDVPVGVDGRPSRAIRTPDPSRTGVSGWPR